MNDALQNLLNAIEQGDQEQTWEAAKGLCSILETEIVSPLISLLRNAERPISRAASAYILGNVRIAFARSSLEEVLSDTNEDALVRGHAAEALAYIGNRDSVPVLIRQLDEKDPEVKYWSIFALGEIADPKAEPALQQVAESVGGLQYRSFSLRAEALDALAKIQEHQIGDQ